MTTETKVKKRPRGHSFTTMLKLTAKECEYLDYEVEDVLTAFYNVLRRELYQGKAVSFERLCRIEIIKPEPRRQWDFEKKETVTSPAHPKLKITPTIGLLDYIRDTEGSSLTIAKGTTSKRKAHASGKTKEYYVRIAKAKKERQKALDEIRKNNPFASLTLPRRT